MAKVDFTFHEESWATLWPELKHLWPEHREETHPKQIVDAAIDVLKYQTLDTQGKLCITTLRLSEGQLCGYHVSIIDKHLHMANYLFAFTTMYFIKHNYRHQGLGKRLFLEAEKNLRKRNVFGIWNASKIALTKAEMLESIGYEGHETVLVKWLQEEKNSW